MENILLIWDIDGTLMHCGSCGREALNKTFMNLFNIENAFQYAEIGHAMDAVLLKKILCEAGISLDKKEDILNKYAFMLRKELEAYKDNRILPGVREILDYTHQQAYIYNCITTSNFEIGARIKLESHHLNAYFVTGGFGDIENEKWHAVQKAIEETESNYHIRFKKENIYIIGDTWYDVECAKRVGVKSIAVATGWTSFETLESYKPDYIFKDLSDYNRIIKRLFHES